MTFFSTLFPCFQYFSFSSGKNAWLMLLISLLSPFGYVYAGFIDFETLADGQPLNNQYSGVTFSNATVAQAGVSLNEFEFPPHSGENVAFDSDGPISLRFESPINLFSAFFTYSTPLEIVAYDMTGGILGKAFVNFTSNLALSGDPGSSPNEKVDLSAQNIAELKISGSLFGTSFVMDDVTFNSITPIPGTIPLPGTHLLLCAALIAFRLSRSIPFPIPYPLVNRGNP